jgi:hypothetical protein
MSGFLSFSATMIFLVFNSGVWESGDIHPHRLFNDEYRTWHSSASVTWLEYTLDA